MIVLFGSGRQVFNPVRNAVQIVLVLYVVYIFNLSAYKSYDGFLRRYNDGP